MFDNYTLGHYGSHTNTIIDRNITIKTAPTDESLKLLAEMKEKTISEVISVTKLENNIISAEWYCVREAMNFSTTCYIRCKINNKEHKLSFNISEFETHDKETHIFELVQEKLSKLVSYELLKTIDSTNARTLLSIRK